MIKAVMQSDLMELSEIITKEFPYINATTKRIRGRIRNENVRLFKFVNMGEIAGFLDLEVDGATGKINAIAVVKEFRGNGFGKTMLRFAIDFLKEHQVQEIILIVKKENLRAKKIYSEYGFTAAGFLDKKIDGSVIEKMQLIIKPTFTNYFA